MEGARKDVSKHNDFFIRERAKFIDRYTEGSRGWTLQCHSRYSIISFWYVLLGNEMHNSSIWLSFVGSQTSTTSSKSQGLGDIHQHEKLTGQAGLMKIVCYGINFRLIWMGARQKWLGQKLVSIANLRKGHFWYPRGSDKRLGKVNSGPPISSDHGLSDISVGETGLDNGWREGEIEGQYDHLRVETSPT